MQINTILGHNLNPKIPANVYSTHKLTKPFHLHENSSTVPQRQHGPPSNEPRGKRGKPTTTPDFTTAITIYKQNPAGYPNRVHSEFRAETKNFNHKILIIFATHLDQTNK